MCWCMPRDFAWSHVHAALDAHGLQPAFDDLWRGLHDTWPLDRAGCVIRDAACATLWTHVTGQGPCRVADLDTLLAPWRFVLEEDSRSRVALTIAHRYPYEVDEDWWAVVDGCSLTRASTDILHSVGALRRP